MWSRERETRWGELSWLAASIRNVSLKKPQQPSEINPWGKPPRKRQPFNLGSLEVLAAAMDAKR